MLGQSLATCPVFPQRKHLESDFELDFPVPFDLELNEGCGEGGADVGFALEDLALPVLPLPLPLFDFLPADLPLPLLLPLPPKDFFNVGVRLPG